MTTEHLRPLMDSPRHEIVLQVGREVSTGRHHPDHPHGTDDCSAQGRVRGAWKCGR